MNLESILQNYYSELKGIKNDAELNELRTKYTGKSGVITEALRGIKDVEPANRKSYGEKVNNIKLEIEKSLSDTHERFVDEAIERQIKDAKRVDLTVPLARHVGSLHPITIVGKRIIDIFASMGFTVEDGNEIETEYNNFEAVNVPKNHPARDMQDTFWLDNGEVLKTQTSAGQNRIMRKYGAPLKAIFPGRCFRNEELDASHENTFFQLEGMMIDKDISISNLIYFMKNMLSQVFGKELQVRLRPGFFPFTEPSFELDSSCPFCGGTGCKTCKHSGWIELCPCGMIHPNVLKMGGIDPEEYQGFAFGLGFTRFAMMTYGIDDIRVLNSGKLKELSQAEIR